MSAASVITTEELAPDTRSGEPRELSMSEDPGVSRSGRVRKKSSKLSDYQSLDDVDQMRGSKRPAKSSPLHTTMISTKTSQLGEQPPDQLLDEEEEPAVDIDLMRDETLDIEEDYEDLPGIEGNEDSDSDSELNQDAPRTEIIKKPENLPAAKRPSRDRATSRVTAYMLWAKQARASVLTSEPSLDTPQVSRRLGEMWAAVPSQDKFTWKTKARRLSSQEAGGQRILEPQQNVRTVARPRVTSELSARLHSVARTADTERSLDLAAHLTLLGESLSIIGGRLREHEGQIAVSGSLSVLLDSLLCSLGPLVCLTQSVPELDGADPDTLASILDNVAYIMPGL